MIEFSKIDKDFVIYKTNRVYLFGASKVGKKCKEILEKNGVSVSGFIDSDIRKHGMKFCGQTVISFTDFLEISSYKKNTLIQITSTFDHEITTLIEEGGFDNYITYLEFSVRMRELSKYIVSQNNENLKTWLYNCDLQIGLCNPVSNLVRNNYFGKKVFSGIQSFDIVLSPFAVGNHAILETNDGKNLIALNHSYKWLDKEIWNVLKKEEIRVLMGVRDPIAQNISLMYQICEAEFWDLEEFWKGGGDVQKIFDEYIIGKSEKKCWYNIYKKEAACSFLVQNFFEEQIEPFLGINVYDFSFNKDKGYSILKHDNVQIFIYQMEKLTSIYDKLAAFFGVKDNKIALNASLLDDKWLEDGQWYGKGRFESGKKSILLSEDYYRGCYSGKYINHFYNKEDIKVFMNRWQANIR